MLEEFSAVKVNTKSLTETTASITAAPKEEPPKAPPQKDSGPLDDAFSEDAFAKQLQAGMADLLGELEKSVSQRFMPGYTLY